MRFNRYRKQAAACLATLTLLLTGPGCSFGMTGGSATIVPLNAASLQNENSAVTTNAASAPSVFGSVQTETTDSSSLFGPGRLTMLANHDTAAQMLSVIIETGQGGLIVVDGGWRENSQYLLEQLKAKGGHVQAWLLTHRIRTM